MDLDAGDLKNAQERFERVLKRNPAHAGSLAALGRIKFEQKDFVSAIDLLRKAVAADSTRREAHYYLGLAYARTGQKEPAEKELLISSQVEHEEVESHRTVSKIMDPDQPQNPAQDETK
jgi:tetratricopeptide (TPR) repeat protein